MSGKMVPDSYQDRYTRESHHDSALRMSTRAMAVVKRKNAKEDIFYRRHLDKLTCDEDMERSQMARTVRSLEREYTELIACKKVLDSYNLQKHDTSQKARSMRTHQHENTSDLTVKPVTHGVKNSWINLLPYLKTCKQDNQPNTETTGTCHFSYDLFPNISLRKTRAGSRDKSKQRYSVFYRSMSEGNAPMNMKRSARADKHWSQTLASVKGILRWKTRLQNNKRDDVLDKVTVSDQKQTSAARQHKSVLPGNCQTIYAFKKLLNRDLKSAVEDETKKSKIRQHFYMKRLKAANVSVSSADI